MNSSMLAASACGRFITDVAPMHAAATIA